MADYQWYVNLRTALKRTGFTNVKIIAGESNPTVGVRLGRLAQCVP